jgi:membrane-bound metal-dependent hydrolase YbcI (DUF457 family)
MPSPLGHTLAALTVHALVSADVDRHDWRRAGLAVAAAVAPDLDLLLRFVDGRNHHQGASHSLGAALLAALGVALVARMLRWPRAARLALIGGLAWCSHVLLDWLGRDTNPPIGLQALWPWSEAYYKSSWLLFLDIGRNPTWTTVVHNSQAMLWEVCLLGPLLWAVWSWRTSQGLAHSGGTR